MIQKIYTEFHPAAGLLFPELRRMAEKLHMVAVQQVMTARYENFFITHPIISLYYQYKKPYDFLYYK